MGAGNRLGSSAEELRVRAGWAGWAIFNNRDRIPSPSICAIPPKDTETEVVISVLWVYLRRCAPAAGDKSTSPTPSPPHYHPPTSLHANRYKHVKQCQY